MSGVTYPKTWVNSETLTHTDLNAQFAAVNTAVGAASGLASLNASSLTVEDPANATATKAAGKICKWGTSEAFQCSALTATTISGTTITGSGVVQGTQLTSTIADGTAPLIVTSTTEVANLKAATATLAARVTFRGALVYHSTTNSIPSNSATVLNFNTEIYDTDSIHDTVTNNSRLTVPAGVTRVRLRANVELANDSDYTRIWLAIYKNGAAFNGYPRIETPGGNYYPSLNLSSPVFTVIEGDYFTAVAFQINTSTGANTTVVQSTWFSMELVE